MVSSISGLPSFRYYTHGLLSLHQPPEQGDARLMSGRTPSVNHSLLKWCDFYSLGLKKALPNDEVRWTAEIISDPLFISMQIPTSRENQLSISLKFVQQGAPISVTTRCKCTTSSALNRTQEISQTTSLSCGLAMGVAQLSATSYGRSGPAVRLRWDLI